MYMYTSNFETYLYERNTNVAPSMISTYRIHQIFTSISYLALILEKAKKEKKKMDMRKLDIDIEMFMQEIPIFDLFQLQSKIHEKPVRKEPTTLNEFPRPHLEHSPRSFHSAKIRPSPLEPSKLGKVIDNIIRYQGYLDESIDEQFLAPLQNRWLTRATKLIGTCAKRLVSANVYHEVCVVVAEEINKVYKQAMRKAILDYILRVTYVSLS